MRGNKKEKFRMKFYRRRVIKMEKIIKCPHPRCGKLMQRDGDALYCPKCGQNYSISWMKEIVVELMRVPELTTHDSNVLMERNTIPKG